MDVNYNASRTLSKLHANDDDFVRAVMGPFGSGKSVGMCIEIMLRAVNQTPDLTNTRNSKWVIVRNTYRELHDTTINTWHDWFPKSLGIWRKMDLTHTIVQKLPDGTTLNLTVMFRALDKPSDVSKLLSLELTGAWLNEAREIPKQILEALVGRISRYPSPRDFGVETYTEDLYWSGIIMDTNPPDNDHWWYNLFEEDKPDGYILYKQPGGESKNAENRKNLHPDYYKRLKAGRDKNWVDVYVNGSYGFITDGMPVYPEFKFDVHVLTQDDLDNDIDNDYAYNPRLDLWVGLDFGRTPAACFAQKNNHGQWVFLEEMVTHNTGAVKFGELLGERIRKNYRNPSNLFIFGDPSGDYGGQASDDTPFSVLREQGIDAYPAPSQDPIIRRESFAIQMTRLADNGKPKLAIHPDCNVLIKGCSGGFKFKRVQVTGEERFQNVPDKNRFSHVCESAEYLLVGAGEDVTWMGSNETAPLDYSNLNKSA